MTLNELIDSLTTLREKENAGECPVMLAYTYDADEPLISWVSKKTGEHIDGYQDYDGSYESFLEEYTQTVVIEGYMC